MADRKKPEHGRGERVLPGVWRLRLPLPWPGVPHGNAWALAAGDGIVLVDTGIHSASSFAELELALRMVGLSVDDVRLLVCTHAHSDHYGQAAAIVKRTGCELWMHPDIAHMTEPARDPEASYDQRAESAIRSGVPEEMVRAGRESRRGQGFGISGLAEPDRPLGEGDEVETDLGTWSVVETPGHAPSHICLYEPERRILISGDHLLGKVSLYYDRDATDPVGAFLTSLDRVDDLGARLCLAGHGRTFTSVDAHIKANRELVGQRLQDMRHAIAGEPSTAFEVMPSLYDFEVPPAAVQWLLSETLCYLEYLEARGEAERLEGAVERWRLAGD
jgi:glyoxylase-like metal-dependent hydrolase (beta-lactamase superfamily II)